MYMETNTTELAIAAGASDTAELKFSKAFGAVRITLTPTAGEGGAAANTAPTTAMIDRVLIELPSRGGLSRRLNLSGAEVKMAPAVCALGAGSAAEAAMTSSYPLFTGFASQISNYSYFDIPVAASADEEIRITIALAAGATPCTVKFTALQNVEPRELIWEVTSLGTGTRQDHTFRSDVTPFAVIIGSGAALYTFDATTNAAYADMTEINFDGIPAYTYDDISALNVELDKIITSSSVADGRDAQSVDCAVALVPAGVKKLNIESNTSGSYRWVIVAYIATPVTGVVA